MVVFEGKVASIFVPASHYLTFIKIKSKRFIIFFNTIPTTILVHQLFTFPHPALAASMPSPKRKILHYSH